MGTPPRKTTGSNVVPLFARQSVGQMALGRRARGQHRDPWGVRFSAGGHARQAFVNPPTPPVEFGVYNSLPLRRHNLAWASATATARGPARAYVPWSSGGNGKAAAIFADETIAAVTQRQGRSERDHVLGKPLGWAQGFLKKMMALFHPIAPFGHPGMRGAGWCDPARNWPCVHHEPL
ncbi:MAG: hypothetical protein IPI80_14545 [Burkholderiales bacterium]|nr:hypothetical protein [Burkholderiales bacterium]